MDHSAILSLPGSERISVLKEKMLDEPRYVSIEQARIVGARPKGRLVAELAEYLPTLSR